MSLHLINQVNSESQHTHAQNHQQHAIFTDKLLLLQAKLASRIYYIIFGLACLNFCYLLYQALLFSPSKSHNINVPGPSRTLEVSPSFTVIPKSNPETLEIPFSLFDATITSFTATLSDGSPLPNWIQLSSKDREFVIQLTSTDTTLRISLTGATAVGQSVTKSIIIYVLVAERVLGIIQKDFLVKKDAMSNKALFLDSGDLLIVYQNSDFFSPRIFFQEIDLQGKSLVGHTPITNQPSDQRRPSVSILSNSQSVIMWNQLDNNENYPYLKIGNQPETKLSNTGSLFLRSCNCSLTQQQCNDLMG